MKKVVTIAVAAAFLAGCAAPMHSYQPLVDGDTTSTQYQRDLEECRAYAMTKPSAENSAAVGAIVGALAGVALLALGGGRGGWGIMIDKLCKKGIEIRFPIFFKKSN